MVKVNLPGFSRRTILGAAVAVPAIAGAGWLVRQYMSVPRNAVAGLPGQSVAFQAYPTGYGPDPELIYPERMIWPSRLTDSQRSLLSWAADKILPAQASWPSASELGVPSFLDEWLSAPYPEQVSDFDLIMPMLDEVTNEDEASLNRKEDPGRMNSSEWISAHSRLTELVVAGYFCSRRGNELLGFIGNQPSDQFFGPPDGVIANLEHRLDLLQAKTLPLPYE